MKRGLEDERAAERGADEKYGGEEEGGKRTNGGGRDKPNTRCRKVGGGYLKRMRQLVEMDVKLSYLKRQ